MIYSSTANGGYDLYYYDGRKSVRLTELCSDKNELGADYYSWEKYEDYLNNSRIMGDVNCDGEFTIADVVLLQKWLLAVPDAELGNSNTNRTHPASDHYKENSPQEILDMLSALVDSDNFIFVGQSLGGWFADKLSRKFGCPCILTNPCYYPYDLGIIRDSGIPAEFVKQYREMSVYNKNERAYTLCSDADTILPNNNENCLKLSQYVTSVHGSHSTIENVGEHLSALLAEVQNDRLLLFLGRGSAFADEHSSLEICFGNII